MSADILNRVWKAAPAGLTPFHRLLLVRLAWYADDSGGNCYAAVSTLARETGAKDRGVRNAMAELRERGFIRVEPNAGPNRTNRVALLMEEIESSETLHGGAALHGDAGMHGDAGLTLHGDAGYPAWPCTSPLHGGAANKQERPKKQKKDTSRAKREAIEPRHNPFRSAFETYYQHVNKRPAPWDGRQAKALSEFLAANPTWTLTDWQEMLQNRKRSDVAPGEPLSQWIASAPTLATSPIDRYGKPKLGPVSATKPIYGNPNWRTEHA